MSEYTVHIRNTWQWAYWCNHWQQGQQPARCCHPNSYPAAAWQNGSAKHLRL